jgi:D-amino peptidase
MPSLLNFRLSTFNFRLRSHFFAEIRMRSLAAVLALVVAAPLAAQNPVFANKRVPFEPGFRVFIVPDMEGMASVVFNREIIAGVEGERYRNQSSPDYWEHYRGLFTQEVNSAIAGARAAGARSFVVNEGHGGNLFANMLPWELDQEAILIRGYPKPLVMMTGIDSTFGTVMFIGAHANAGSPGVISHNYAFDTLSVNGIVLNEVGINALMAGEVGVSVSLVSGDDVVVEEAKRILGNGVIGVVVKTAVGRSAAIAWSPARVREMLQKAAREAIEREMRGDFKPFTLQKPYRLQFKIRQSYPEALIAPMADLVEKFNLEQVGPRTYRMTATDARQIGYLLDAIEEIVLR